MTLPSRPRNRRAVDLTPSPEAAAAQQPDTEMTTPEPQGCVGYITTTRTAYGAGEETHETVTVPVFHCDPARVRVTGSATKNLGDFNSAKVEVSIDMPCLPEETEIRRTYERLSGNVDAMIREELAYATGETVPTAPPAQPPHPGANVTAFPEPAPAPAPSQGSFMDGPAGPTSVDPAVTF